MMGEAEVTRHDQAGLKGWRPSNNNKVPGKQFVDWLLQRDLGSINSFLLPPSSA
jgi:hypothetical protein